MKTSGLLSSATGVTGCLVVIYLAGNGHVAARLGAKFEHLRRTLETAELNREDAAQLQRGYYEELMGVARLNSNLWQVMAGAPPAEGLDDVGLAKKRPDELMLELIPGRTAAFHGKKITINSEGFRDREYSKARPADAYRIAVLGASITMGWGVADGEAFESRLEEHLAEAATRGHSPFAHYEVLNFAVAGYTAPQHLIFLRRVLSFEPQSVLMVAHEVDAERMVHHLVKAAESGYQIQLDTLARIVAKAWDGAPTVAVAEKRLTPHRWDLLRIVYRAMVDTCRAHGVVPVLALVPRLELEPQESDLNGVAEAAADAGFVVVDLRHVYDGHDRRTIRLSDADRHPNPAGHQLVGDSLYARLLQVPELASQLPAAP